MILKNIASQGVYLEAIDTTTTPYSPKTGNAAQITGTQSLDGATPGTAFGTTNPTEIGGGLYWQPLAQAESNGNAYGYRWVSATSGIVINPVVGFTSGVNLPAVAPGSGAGLTTFANQLTAAQIATGIWEDTTAGGDFGTAGSIGLLLATDINATIGSRLATAGYTAPPTAAAIGAVVAAGSVASVVGAVGSVTAGVTVTINSDKTGYALSAAGLNSIPITAVTGLATTFPQLVVQLWRRFFKSSAKAVSGLTIKEFADDGVTVIVTQTYTDDGAGNQTMSAGS